MIQGTTPMHSFTFPEDPSIFSEIEITYQQLGIILFQKYKKDLTFDTGNVVKFKLTQEETLMFSLNSPVRIQVKVLTSANDVLASQIFDVPVKEILNPNVLED